MAIRTVLLDLDGVIRHFDPGGITRATWVSRVGEIVGNEAAATEWLGNLGLVDPKMVAVVDRLRQDGVTVAVLTNGTDTIPAEMEELGLLSHFDRIFNTAEIGFAKPDRRAFDHVCNELDVRPEDVFFADDSQKNVAGAAALGIRAGFFSGVEQFLADLPEAGISFR